MPYFDRGFEARDIFICMNACPGVAGLVPMLIYQDEKKVTSDRSTVKYLATLVEKHRTAFYSD